jgi:hypothetical protein
VSPKRPTDKRKERRAGPRSAAARKGPGATALDRKSPEQAAPERKRPTARSRLRRILGHRALPWGLFAVALAAAVTFAVLWLTDSGTDEATSEVRDTSRRFLAALTNFSAQTIEEDVEEIRSFGVGRFADEVEDTFSSSRIAAIRQNEVVSTGRVESVFVQTIEGSTATVFGVVNETIVNAVSVAPRVEVLRVELELIETPDGWKVSSVEILQSPAAAPFAP